MDDALLDILLCKKRESIQVIKTFSDLLHIFSELIEKS